MNQKTTRDQRRYVKKFETILDVLVRRFLFSVKTKTDDEAKVLVKQFEYHWKKIAKQANHDNAGNYALILEDAFIKQMSKVMKDTKKQLRDNSRHQLK